MPLLVYSAHCIRIEPYSSLCIDNFLQKSTRRWQKLVFRICSARTLMQSSYCNNYLQCLICVLRLCLALCNVMAVPDNKVHEANTGPTWLLLAPDRPHVDPMNLTIRGVIIWLACAHVCTSSVYVGMLTSNRQLSAVGHQYWQRQWQGWQNGVKVFVYSARAHCLLKIGTLIVICCIFMGWCMSMLPIYLWIPSLVYLKILWYDVYICLDL